MTHTVKVPLLGVMVEVSYLYHPPIPERPASYASGGEPGEGHWAEISDVKLNGVSIELDDLYFREGTGTIAVLQYLAEMVADAHLLNDGW